MNHPTKHFCISDAGFISKVLHEHAHNQGLLEEPGHLDPLQTAIISCNDEWTTRRADIGLFVPRNAAGTWGTVNTTLEMEAMVSDEMKILGHQ
mmetsp:Transcript_66019/g.130126  ORF Transcript_66019/g.130126 Transcript_66019/m.130126 type:complete len:93 (-) Transcript_66019:332-610(-)